MEPTTSILRTALRQARTPRFRHGLTDQAMSSASNVILSLLLVRTASLAAFGSLSLALAWYLLALSLGRATSSEPFVYAYAPRSDSGRGGMAGALGAAACVGACCGIATAVYGLIGGSEASSFVTLGVAMPLLLVQDAVRFLSIAGAKPQVAVECDAVWVIVAGALVIFTATVGPLRAEAVFRSWCLAGSLAAVYGVWRLGVMPSLSSARRWAADNRHRIPLFASELVVAGVIAQALPFLLRAIVGLRGVGQFRAATLALGPISSLFMGVQMVLAPSIARLAWDGRAGRVRKACQSIAIVLGSTSLATGVILIAAPPRFVAAIMGPAWLIARPLVVGAALYVASSGAAMATMVGVKALGAVASSARIRAVAGVATLGLSVVGALAAGTQGAVIGMAAGGWVAGIGYWRSLSRTASASMENQVLHYAFNRPDSAREEETSAVGVNTR